MRTFFFYLLLGSPILIWSFIVLPTNFSVIPDYSGIIITTLVAASPIVGGDISVVGEVTPIMLAGAIIALAPASQNINYIGICIAIIAYLLFVHLSVFFAAGAGAGLISANWSDVDEPRKILLGLITNVRVTIIVVAASILGFKVKGA